MTTHERAEKLLIDLGKLHYSSGDHELVMAALLEVEDAGKEAVYELNRAANVEVRRLFDAIHADGAVKYGTRWLGANNAVVQFLGTHYGVNLQDAQVRVAVSGAVLALLDWLEPKE